MKSPSHRVWKMSKSRNLFLVLVGVFWINPLLASEKCPDMPGYQYSVDRSAINSRDNGNGIIWGYLVPLGGKTIPSQVNLDKTLARLAGKYENGRTSHFRCQKVFSWQSDYNERVFKWMCYFDKDGRTQTYSPDPEPGSYGNTSDDPKSHDVMIPNTSLDLIRVWQTDTDTPGSEYGSANSQDAIEKAQCSQRRLMSYQLNRLGDRRRFFNYLIYFITEMPIKVARVNQQSF